MNTTAKLEAMADGANRRIALSRDLRIFRSSRARRGSGGLGRPTQLLVGQLLTDCEMLGQQTFALLDIAALNGAKELVVMVENVFPHPAGGGDPPAPNDVIALQDAGDDGVDFDQRRGVRCFDQARVEGEVGRAA